jgi:hypothetical protein
MQLLFLFLFLFHISSEARSSAHAYCHISIVARWALALSFVGYFIARWVWLALALFGDMRYMLAAGRWPLAPWARIAEQSTWDMGTSRAF